MCAENGNGSVAGPDVVLAGGQSAGVDWTRELLAEQLRNGSQSQLRQPATHGRADPRHRLTCVVHVL